VNTAAIRDSGFGNRIKEAGDSALLLELEAVIDPDVNACAVAIASAVAARRLPGVRDIVPTFHSVAVHFDPLATDVDAVRRRSRRRAAWSKCLSRTADTTGQISVTLRRSPGQPSRS
jgi:allophanate hydrolase subunit 1